jgi:DNA-binding response OmpR family regulator
MVAGMSAAADQVPEQRVVLVVDDEPALVDILSTYLRDEGFRVIAAGDGRAAIAAARAENPDIVLLDLNLPLVSGVEAFRAIRARSNVPVIMLTSRVNEVDRIVGLELGADDYVTKPFSPRGRSARQSGPPALAVAGRVARRGSRRATNRTARDRP